MRRCFKEIRFFSNPLETGGGEGGSGLQVKYRQLTCFTMGIGNFCLQAAVTEPGQRRRRIEDDVYGGADIVGRSLFKDSVYGRLPTVVDFNMHKFFMIIIFLWGAC